MQSDISVLIRQECAPSINHQVWWRQDIPEDRCVHSNSHESIKSHSMAANEMCQMCTFSICQVLPYAVPHSYIQKLGDINA